MQGPVRTRGLPEHPAPAGLQFAVEGASPALLPTQRTAFPNRTGTSTPGSPLWEASKHTGKFYGREPRVPGEHVGVRLGHTLTPSFAHRVTKSWEKGLP